MTTFGDFTDEALAGEAAKGNRKAFELLYDRYAPKLKAYFFQMLWKNAELAEDMTQELFIKVVENLSGFDTKRSFKTWLFSTANNMCKNAYRHNEVKEKAAMHLAYVKPEFLSEPQKIMDNQVFKAELERKLNAMDDKKREAFILRYKHDLSIKEIATVVGAKEGTIKSRMFHAIKELAHELSSFNPKKNHG